MSPWEYYPISVLSVFIPRNPCTYLNSACLTISEPPTPSGGTYISCAHISPFAKQIPSAILAPRLLNFSFHLHRNLRSFMSTLWLALAPGMYLCRQASVGFIIYLHSPVLICPDRLFIPIDLLYQGCRRLFQLLWWIDMAALHGWLHICRLGYFNLYWWNDELTSVNIKWCYQLLPNTTGGAPLISSGFYGLWSYAECFGASPHLRSAPHWSKSGSVEFTKKTARIFGKVDDIRPVVYMITLHTSWSRYPCKLRYDLLC